MRSVKLGCSKRAAHPECRVLAGGPWHCDCATLIAPALSRQPRFVTALLDVEPCRVASRWGSQEPGPNPRCQGEPAVEFPAAWSPSGKCGRCVPYLLQRAGLA